VYLFGFLNRLLFCRLLLLELIDFDSTTLEEMVSTLLARFCPREFVVHIIFVACFGADFVFQLLDLGLAFLWRRNKSRVSGYRPSVYIRSIRDFSRKKERGEKARARDNHSF
jgi:hypothetical protein